MDNTSNNTTRGQGSVDTNAGNALTTPVGWVETKLPPRVGYSLADAQNARNAKCTNCRFWYSGCLANQAREAKMACAPRTGN